MKLLVLDGNSIVNRAFYGIKLLTNKNGEYTNAIYGFLNILLKLEDICSPDAVAVAFDVHAPTFRHKMYDEYKAGRKGMPDELRAQMPVLKEMLKNLGIKTIEKEGWEADDILGILRSKYAFWKLDFFIGVRGFRILLRVLIIEAIQSLVHF